MDVKKTKEADLLQILPYHFVACLFYWWRDWTPQFESLSPDWVKLWGGVTMTPSIFDKNKVWYPGASTRFQRFQDKEGFYFLERLASKGADANFIMPIFVAYLWNGEVPQTMRMDFIVKEDQKVLRAIVAVKEYYRMYFEYPTNRLTKTSDPRDRRKIQRIANIYGGAPHKGFNKVIALMEDKVRDQLALKDGISPRQGKLPADRENRVVFTIHHHITKSTGSPQWEDFWNLLVAAGVLPDRKPLSAKDRQIGPRIKSFEQHHPREAKAIIKRVIP